VGNLLTVTDALGNVTEYQYDNLFRQILVIAADPDGTGGLASPETEFSYDLLGRMTSMTDPLDRVASYEYDVLGRRIKVVQPDPDGVGGEDPPETDYEYDFAGNLVSVTDPLGNVTTYAYDNLYRRVSTTQPDPDAGGALSAPVTSFSYDAAGNMTSLTDPVGNVTSWVYDAHNRTIEETNELSDTRYFEYDVAGNLIEKTDRNGLVTQFTYDNLYRLTQELWLDGVNTVNTLDFTYDAASQMLTAADDVSSYAYTYNGLGQVTLIEIDNGGPLVELAQEFTPVGSRSLLAASFDDGGGMDDDFQNIFYYDNLQRMVQIDQGGVQGGNTVAEKRVNFAYNAAGQFTSIDRYKDLDGGSGNLVVETDFVYDGIGRLTDLTHVYDTTTIADYDWTFDAFSRVTSMSFSSLVGNDGSSTYDYDDTNQLIDADHDFQTDEAYTYDENGNRTISGYTTGDNNLLTSDGTYDYEYDAEGNRVLKTNISTGDYIEYAWDHRNRLIKITQRDNLDAITHEVIYTYDIFNRRITKEIDADGAGGGGVETAQYIYDNDDIILAFDGAEALTNRYLHGPMVDQILADEDSLGEVLWPLPDNLGSIRDLVESDGSVVNHITYDAYGAITSETAPSVDHIYAYTGRERDEESEFYHNRNRYYAPLIGQWASEDPILFSAGDSNPRRYVSNHPSYAIDPHGLEERWVLTRIGEEWYWQYSGPGYVHRYVLGVIENPLRISGGYLIGESIVNTHQEAVAVSQRGNTWYIFELYVSAVPHIRSFNEAACGEDRATGEQLDGLDRTFRTGRGFTVLASAIGGAKAFGGPKGAPRGGRPTAPAGPMRWDPATQSLVPGDLPPPTSRRSSPLPQGPTGPRPLTPPTNLPRGPLGPLDPPGTQPLPPQPRPGLPPQGPFGDGGPFPPRPRGPFDPQNPFSDN
jgi:RHS repeat-associated protein